MSRTQAPRKPKKQKSFRNLSDPKTLSELALRLKEGIYITTLDGEIIDANPAFLEMFGIESLEEADAALYQAKRAGRDALRSEERRVGKECRLLCRSRWSPYH